MTRVEKLLLLLLPLPFGLGFLAPGPVTEPLESETVFAFTDPEIVESSGLVARGGLVVTVNDSGDGNRIFTVDPVTGGTVGTTRWQGDARDIEALAPAGAGRVYVGDIGDNMGSRERIQVARVPAGRGERMLSASRPGQGVVTLEHRGLNQDGVLVARAVRTALRPAEEVPSTGAPGTEAPSPAPGRRSGA